MLDLSCWFASEQMYRIAARNSAWCVHHGIMATDHQVSFKTLGWPVGSAQFLTVRFTGKLILVVANLGENTNSNGDEPWVFQTFNPATVSPAALWLLKYERNRLKWLRWAVTRQGLGRMGNVHHCVVGQAPSLTPSKWFTFKPFTHGLSLTWRSGVEIRLEGSH